uniref:Uncharacterized protein n=1 Tax=Lymantria dispar multicapsid nuclear polyhedrosis virus TaxID=10449 RepID=A0A7S8FAC5_NPVLD|nr:hypothetical protein [Lymantria dispar multiple nucleopolyhedrovirus]QPD02103.1 hypothetical protein [Lymantria dispar multiple nucleopolyhedrovirus]
MAASVHIKGHDGMLYLFRNRPAHRRARLRPRRVRRMLLQTGEVSRVPSALPAASAGAPARTRVAAPARTRVAAPAARTRHARRFQILLRLLVHFHLRLSVLYDTIVIKGILLLKAYCY